ncbi:hypothetical protein PN471_17240 [Aphanizomenon sp. CS-733/32]|uniref:hypothetical protein n=1 Tax=Aphanizomenon sp. CS-733/32 TaxID=3021715 RepID=UPI00232FE3F3|nr:hypothetical protein [Aphanizomenon sp. CS-733/32]MDB9310344.1 hypothetical protein [Aphanizomenon sp. CS-733/32]
MVQTQSFINENSLTEILPGGSNPDAFELAQTWYPVHYLQDLDKSKPTPFTLLEVV